MDVSLLHKVRNIHAVGMNYVKHIHELNSEVPSEPVLFAKSPSCLAVSDTIRLPKKLAPIHHELELVMRIGEFQDVGSFQSLSCISHMTIGLDFTARERQWECKKKGLPWHMAKNFKNACYVAPFSAQFDITSPFHFRLWKNGELRQDGNSTNMIYSFETLVAFINGQFPLEPGDLIFTGTPEGVGPLEDGDRLRLACPELGIDVRLNIEMA